MISSKYRLCEIRRPRNSIRRKRADSSRVFLARALSLSLSSLGEKPAEKKKGSLEPAEASEPRPGSTLDLLSGNRRITSSRVRFRESPRQGPHEGLRRRSSASESRFTSRFEERFDRGPRDRYRRGVPRARAYLLYVTHPCLRGLVIVMHYMYVRLYTRARPATTWPGSPWIGEMGEGIITSVRFGT